MESCHSDVIGGFNSFIKEQDPNSTLTLVQFDHEYLVSFSDVKMSEVKPLTNGTYVPRGSTALLDAVGKFIKSVSDTLPRTVAIFTDGLENSSKSYTKAHLKDLVEQKTKDGWKFIYMGANQDAYAEAGSIGICAQNTMEYDSNKTPEAFGRLSATLSQA
jgi:hypothetical protein